MNEEHLALNSPKSSIALKYLIMRTGYSLSNLRYSLMSKVHNYKTFSQQHSLTKGTPIKVPDLISFPHTSLKERHTLWEKKNRSN